MSLSFSVEKLRHVRSAELRRRTRRAWSFAAALALSLISLSPTARPVTLPFPVQDQPAPLPADQPLEKVFLVDRTPRADLYSNGLQIQSAYTTQSVLRKYRTFDGPDRHPSLPLNSPAGLVFHTTESLLIPIQPASSKSLTSTRNNLLEHVRLNCLYNFVIDRFGQVFRIVPETQVAFHAGHSIWADRDRVFIDLNDSFAGIAFEAHTGEDSTPAQRHSGRLLTAMLRSAFGIPDANCVTHAQVSVNPDNFRIGYHTDWGARFPFLEMNLQTGYQAPVASIAQFGFTYDETFLGAIGGRPWAGVVAAENQLLNGAAVHGLTPARYRALLQKQYQAVRRLNNERS